MGLGRVTATGGADAKYTNTQIHKYTNTQSGMLCPKIGGWGGVTAAGGADAKMPNQICIRLAADSILMLKRTNSLSSYSKHAKP